MRPVPRPEEKTLFVERKPIEGTCEVCDSVDLAEYPVISEGGWWTVVKCQACLHSVSRTRGPLFGSLEPMTGLIGGGVDA
jgi:vanillate/4-hydroxybenzoate decarboxylase subunit D